MGLLDILNGMQNGPRGQRQPSGTTGSGGMSPLTMAMLGILAYKAIKTFTGAQSASPSGGRPPSPPGASGRAWTWPSGRLSTVENVCRDVGQRADPDRPVQPRPAVVLPQLADHEHVDLVERQPTHQLARLVK